MNRLSPTPAARNDRQPLTACLGTTAPGGANVGIALSSYAGGAAYGTFTDSSVVITGLIIARDGDRRLIGSVMG